MRIVVLSKRQYTGKDLLDDRYGRLYEIPAALAKGGHDVLGITLSYRPRTAGWFRRNDIPNFNWLSVNALPVGVLSYPWQLAKAVADFRPEVIWACSDAFHAILGHLLSRLTGIPLVIDLYDNFESFAATRFPGVRSLFRMACRHANSLTVVSQTYRDHVVSTYGVQSRAVVVGNGVRRDLFYPRDKQSSRAVLGLPSQARIIGTAGAISNDRSIAVLFDAFIQLAAADPDLYLVFAGPRDKTPTQYQHPRIVDLGILPLDQVPILLSALDVAVVCNRDSDFGRNAFPLKFFEIIACGIPIVATRLGDVATILKDYPGCLYSPENVAELMQRIADQLATPQLPKNLEIPRWNDWSVVTEAVLSVARSQHET